MSNKRGPRAPVKLDAELKNRQPVGFSALIVERNRRLDIVKACQRSRNPSTEKTPSVHQLAGRIHGIRRDLGRTALKDLRARWFENADHDEIKRQLNGEVAFTFTYEKPECGCPLRSQISDAFLRWGR